METFKGWTVRDVVRLRACYSRERLTELWAGRERLTIREVCDLGIPATDRLWLLCRAPWPVIEPVITRIVERVVRTHALVCGVPAVEAWATRWLSGEDRTEEAAGVAAAAAWEAAAWEAARAAAWAAWDAARDAARAAARAAEWSAEADNERDRQIADFMELCG